MEAIEKWYYIRLSLYISFIWMPASIIQLSLFLDLSIVGLKFVTRNG